jgi:hypothetical protein
MRYTILAAMILGAVGCASPQRIERNAVAHENQAQYYESIGDYRRANDEWEAAAKQHEKAARRAEAYQVSPITPPQLR